jgi:Spy/CpxP family protein refolding chaperone
MTTPTTPPADPSATLGTPRRARGRLVAFLVLLLVALGGGLAGVAIDRLVLLPRHFGGRPPIGDLMGGPMGRHTPQDREREFRDRMARELGLSESQRVRIDSLMERRLLEVRAIREQARPGLDSVLVRTRRQIDSILTPEQREKAQAMVRRGGLHGRGPMGPLLREGIGPPPGGPMRPPR